MSVRILPAALMLAACWPASWLWAADWPMWGGTAARNNTSDERVPTMWNTGGFDRGTGEWDAGNARNVKWIARLGSQSYGNPVVSGGRVFVGTNNGAGYLGRFPADQDMGCLLCFRESDGRFLWQYSAAKLRTGRVHDWPLQGICSAPLVESDRMWFVDNRGRVVCLDVEGFTDGEDDGEVVTEHNRLFAFVPGVPDGHRSRYNQVLLDDRIAISELFAAHAGADTRCSWLKRDDTRDAWTIATFNRNRRTEYRMELNDFRIRVFRSGERDDPLFDVEQKSLRELHSSRLPVKVRQRLEKAGVSLGSHVAVKTITPGEQWSVECEYEGKEQTIWLRRVGFWLTGSWTVTPQGENEADVVWRLDMMKDLGVRQHNMATCAPAAWGDTLFICTSNGVDESHLAVPAPQAPSFIAVDKHSGRVLWRDNSPGEFILHGQWSAPAVGEFNGIPQVIFPGGDGWIYSFRADTWDEQTGKPILLWKFDANPKDSKWMLGGRGTRNNAIAIPVLYDGRVYVSVGQDPEHGDGKGHLWCLDPNRRGDVSEQLAVRFVDGRPTPIPRRRVQAVIEEEGEAAIDNPNSAVVWRYDGFDQDGDGKVEFEEEFHRTISSPAIKNGLLFIPDISGLMHCLDARTGKVHWTCDLLAACWGSPLIAGDKVYIGDEDGDVAVFQLSADPKLSTKRTEFGRGTTTFVTEPKVQHLMKSQIYSTPVVANGVLYISDRSHLYAIQEDESP